MSNATKDNNRVATLLGTSSADGVSVIPLQVNGSHRLSVQMGTGGHNFPFTNSEKDQDRNSAIWGVSSADGVTPVPIYCDANGDMLTQRT